VNGVLSLLRRLGIRDTVRAARDIRRGGGARSVRVKRIGPPEGLVFATSAVELEVVARDGSRATLSPGFPVPFPYAWAYRVARALGVPLA
jgi:hypothetical protein